MCRSVVETSRSPTSEPSGTALQSTSLHENHRRRPMNVICRVNCSRAIIRTRGDSITSESPPVRAYDGFKRLHDHVTNAHRSTKMQLAASKGGGWEYTDRQPGSEMEIPRERKLGRMHVSMDSLTWRRFWAPGVFLIAAGALWAQPTQSPRSEQRRGAKE